MECLSFAEPKPAGGAEAGSVEVYVYDQGTPLQAFGMYGSERTGDEKPLQLGQEGHDSEGSLYFWRDRYYCQVQPSSNAQPAVEQAAELAAQLNDKLPRTEFQVPGLTWFPKQGLKPGTITYVLKEGLGQDWFDDLYTAKYDVGGVEVQAFVARRDTEAKAAELLAKYQAFLKSSKAKVSQVKLSGVSMTEMDDKGMVDIVFRRGTTFAGVSYVEGKRPAETIAARLAAQ
ncbi:MAG: hypothetical protein HYU66_18995 [Armatimonadetes bacterium]|nr:hypothetical protein [Armatimonadota bacterium]